MTGLLLRFLVLGTASLPLVTSSAIPMWEFLTRGEKMSHLFNMFVKQVAEHCDSSNMPDCQKVLLVYGLTNLAKMEDDSLDKMDPYQRGANDIIWESMMHGSYKKKTEEHRDYYSDALEPSTSDGNSLGTQEEASSKVERYPERNGYPPLGGPMVVRVRPDGSPVPGEEDRLLPKDEDKEEYQVMRSQPLPSLEDLQSGKNYATGGGSLVVLPPPAKHHRHYSSIADILAQVEASTYKPNRPYTGIEDLLATRRPTVHESFGKQVSSSFSVVTPPPGYIHHESLSEIEEQYHNQAGKATASNHGSSHRQLVSSPPDHHQEEGEIMARHVSSSVSASRGVRHT